MAGSQGLLLDKCPGMLVGCCSSCMNHSQMGASGTGPSNPAHRGLEAFAGGGEVPSHLPGASASGEPVTRAPPVSTNSGHPDTCSASGVAMGTSWRGVCGHTCPCVLTQSCGHSRGVSRAVHTQVYRHVLTHEHLCLHTCTPAPMASHPQVLCSHTGV